MGGGVRWCLAWMRLCGWWRMLCATLRGEVHEERMLCAAVAGEGEKERGREALYAEVAERHGDMIERICFGYARSVADMEDLRQDVMLNLWKALPSFRGDCAMRTWVYRLALNVCVTSLRKSYRRVDTTGINELLDLACCDDEQRETLAALHEAIGLLNPIDRTVVMLWLEEESYESIAAITGLTKGNVAQRIHRAKIRLRKLINT